MNKKYLVLFLAIVLTVGLVALAAGCGSSTTTTAAPATTATTAASGTTTTGSAPATTATTAGGKVVSVKIGAAGPFTGALSKIGMDTLNAIKYAVDQFNTANPTIKVSVDDTGDDAADPAKSAAVAEKFSSDAAIVGVIGPMTSAGVQAALPIYEKNGLAMITQSATNDKLSQQGYKVFHRTAPVDAEQGAAVAGIIGADLKAKKVYIIDDKGTYGQGLADQVTSTLKSKYAFTDAQIVRSSITPDDKDFSSLITKIQAAKPDAFFAAIQSPAQYAAIAKQMQAVGYQVQLVGADGVKDKGEFIDNAAGSTEGTLFTSLGPILDTSTNPAAQELVKYWTAKYGSTSMFTGQSYDATNVLLTAIKQLYDKTGDVTRAGVLDELHNVTYTGVSGIPLAFKDNGDLKTSAVFIGQVKNGQFVELKPANY